MIRSIRYVFPVFSFGLLAIGYFQLNLLVPAIILLVIGFMWVIGLALSWEWISTIGLLAAFGIAAIGILITPSNESLTFLSVKTYPLIGYSRGNQSVLYLISGAFCSFMTWDLANFHNFLCQASPEDDIVGLEHQHLLWLGGVMLISVCLSALALILHLKTSFEWIVLLIFFVVWGVGRMIAWMLEKSN